MVRILGVFGEYKKKTLGSSEITRTHIVAIAKDEGAYLPEWIHHHLYFGFDKIDVYLNRISDNSREVLEKITSKYPNVKLYDGDSFAEEFPTGFQGEIYNHAYQVRTHGSSHILCIDVDEFWTPKNFKDDIKICLKKLNYPDVISFEWSAKTAESSFGSPYNHESINVIRQISVKSLFDTSIRVKRVGVHNVSAPGHINVLADGSEHPRPGTVKIEHLSKELKDYFILHRAWRSDFEYLSDLVKGTAYTNRGIKLDDDLVLKHTRNGFEYSYRKPENIDFDKDLIKVYNDSLESFIEECDLQDELVKARTFVINRFLKLYDKLKSGDYDDSPELSKTLKGIDLELSYEAVVQYVLDKGYANLEAYISEDS